MSVTDSYHTLGTHAHTLLGVINRLRGRAGLGYVPRALPAARPTLDEAFGALELSPGWRVATQIEYDSEKWNAGLGVALPFGIRVRASLLALESLSLGSGGSVSS